jgi:hypothetical protein
MAENPTSKPAAAKPVQAKNPVTVAKPPTVKQQPAAAAKPPTVAKPPGAAKPPTTAKSAAQTSIPRKSEAPTTKPAPAKAAKPAVPAKPAPAQRPSSAVDFSAPDLMPPLLQKTPGGRGVPWEDRGHAGIVMGFLKTAFQMMISPVKTLKALRRREATRDAYGFAIGCGIFWVLGTAIQATVTYYTQVVNDKTIYLDGEWYVINSVLESLLTGAAVLGLTFVAWKLWYMIIAADMKEIVPANLVGNMMAYMLAPSILALIPYAPYGGVHLRVGTILAAVWILALWMIVAKQYLNVRLAGVIVGTILTALACAILACAAWWALDLLWTLVVQNGSVTVLPPPKDPLHH